MEPEFLTIHEVFAIHADQIERYGGDPALLDAGLLISAVNMPRQAFGGRFAHADLFEMAAAYLFHIVQNHAFADGNKRTGAVAAIVFLPLNAMEVTVPEKEFLDLVVEVASGKADKTEIASFFREHHD